VGPRLLEANLDVQYTSLLVVYAACSEQVEGEVDQPEERAGHWEK